MANGVPVSMVVSVASLVALIRIEPLSKGLPHVCPMLRVCLASGYDRTLGAMFLSTKDGSEKYLHIFRYRISHTYVLERSSGATPRFAIERPAETTLSPTEPSAVTASGENV